MKLLTTILMLGLSLTMIGQINPVFTAQVINSRRDLNGGIQIRLKSNNGFTFDSLQIGDIYAVKSGIGIARFTITGKRTTGYRPGMDGTVTLSPLDGFTGEVPLSTPTASGYVYRELENGLIPLEYLNQDYLNWTLMNENLKTLGGSVSELAIPNGEIVFGNSNNSGLASNSALKYGTMPYAYSSQNGILSNNLLISSNNANPLIRSFQYNGGFNPTFSLESQSAGKCWLIDMPVSPAAQFYKGFLISMYNGNLTTGLASQQKYLGIDTSGNVYLGAYNATRNNYSSVTPLNVLYIGAGSSIQQTRLDSFQVINPITNTTPTVSLRTALRSLKTVQTDGIYLPTATKNLSTDTIVTVYTHLYSRNDTVMNVTGTLLVNTAAGTGETWVDLTLPPGFTSDFTDATNDVSGAVLCRPTSGTMVAGIAWPRVNTTSDKIQLHWIGDGNAAVRQEINFNINLRKK